MPINSEALVSKLNAATRAALEGALGLAVTGGNREVELEHYLLKVLESDSGDFLLIAKRWDLSYERLKRDLQSSLSRLSSGWAHRVSPSQPLVRMLTEAWVIASLEHNASAIRTGVTVLALVSDHQLSALAYGLSAELRKINADDLRKGFAGIVEGSREAEPKTQAVAGGTGQTTPGGGSSQLDLFTTDLTELARKGGLDPVLGRESEIAQVIDILLRRRQNNPILTGEAGVGKTAIVEGFAMRVAVGEVPPLLENAAVRTLDIGRLQAGTGVRGEFENRLKGVVDEVQAATRLTILFIDEAHTIIGAGGSAGSTDAANLLKPALARGELRTIAATTWAEYRKYFENDQALARRFQVVKVEEPSEEVCRAMVRGILPKMEGHHKVTILDEALRAAVGFSNRYISDRQLPDKAVSVLDTACARVALLQKSTPVLITEAEARLRDLEAQREISAREELLDVDRPENSKVDAEDIAKAKKRLSTLKEQLEKERELIARIVEISDHVKKEAQGGGGAKEEKIRRKQLRDLRSQLQKVQGDRPLAAAFVDANIVGEVVAAWTGIPVGKVRQDDMTAVLELRSRLAKRIIGQDDALTMIGKRMITARAKTGNPEGPSAVFLLVGPSGVGKTETARALADELYGGERNLITITMTEFQDAYSISTLKGAPPGLVGYKEGGRLTDPIRRRPYSALLLDEMDKAHPNVRQLFLQIFERGRLEDSEGREIDFRNTVILLTTSACGDVITRACAKTRIRPKSGPLLAELKPHLDRTFGMDFMGRVTVVPYFPLSDDSKRRIVALKLEVMKKPIEENYHVRVTYGDSLVAEIFNRCRGSESARNIDAILNNNILPEISGRLLARALKKQAPVDIHVAMLRGQISVQERRSETPT